MFGQAYVCVFVPSSNQLKHLKDLKWMKNEEVKMTPEQIASLPLQVVSFIVIAALFKALQDSQNARISDLKAVYEKGIADLRNRTMMIEDKLGIKRPLADDEPPIPLKMP